MEDLYVVKQGKQTKLNKMISPIMSLFSKALISLLCSK